MADRDFVVFDLTGIVALFSIPLIRRRSRDCRAAWKILTLNLVGCAAIIVTGSTAVAATYLSFDAATQSRFTGGTPNSNFYFDEAAIRGIGINDTTITANQGRATLITPRHYITATHASSTSARFRRADGTFEVYNTTGSIILNTTTPDGVVASDLRIFTLDRDVDPIATGITPLAVLDESTDIGPGLIGQPLVVYDQAENAGRNIIDEFTLVEFGSGPPRTSFAVSYLFEGGSRSLPDEAGLVGGDSGRPGLYDFGGTPVVIGTHFGIDSRPSQGFSFPNGPYPSFTTLITPYLDQIDAHVSQASQGGHSLNRIALPGFTVPTITAVPEPTFAPVALAMGLAAWRRRKTAA